MVNHSDCRIVCKLSDGCQGAFIASFYQRMGSRRFNMRTQKGTHIFLPPRFAYSILSWIYYKNQENSISLKRDLFDNLFLFPEFTKLCIQISNVKIHKASSIGLSRFMLGQLDKTSMSICSKRVSNVNSPGTLFTALGLLFRHEVRRVL